MIALATELVINFFSRTDFCTCKPVKFSPTWDVRILHQNLDVSRQIFWFPIAFVGVLRPWRHPFLHLYKNDIFLKSLTLLVRQSEMLKTGKIGVRSFLSTHCFRDIQQHLFYFLIIILPTLVSRFADVRFNQCCHSSAISLGIKHVYSQFKLDYDKGIWSAESFEPFSCVVSHWHQRHNKLMLKSFRPTNW